MTPRPFRLTGIAGRCLQARLAGCALLLVAAGAGAQVTGTATPADAATPTSAPPVVSSPASAPAAPPTLVTVPATPATAAGAATPATGAGAAPDISVYQRRSLLPLVQPLWSELSARQQQVLAPFAAQWNSLPIEEKRAWKALAERFPRLSAGERRHAEKRIREWALLTPDQRKLARQNFRLAKELPKDERIAQWEQYQNMTDEQRQVLQHGSTSNTAARHAGSRTALAKEADQPIAEVVRRSPQTVSGVIKPANANQPGTGAVAPKPAGN